jgi:hypothetical protein
MTTETAIALETALADEVKFCARCGYPIDEQERAAPLEPGHRRVFNYEVERIFIALTTLSQRKLPSPRAEDKIAILLRRYFDVPYQVFEQRKKMALTRHALSPDSDQQTVPASVAELRQVALHSLFHETQDIPEIPAKYFLTANDMPSKKDDPGGVSAIKFQLGFLYELDDVE